MFKRFSVVFLSLSLILVPVDAAVKIQAPVIADRKRIEIPPEEKQELEKKALALLNEVVTEAIGLRLPENRIQILSFAGDILWKRDENRSRGYFREAINQFLAIQPSAADIGIRPNQTSQIRQMLRSQLIQAIGEHDPQMALEFLRASRLPAAARQNPQDLSPDSDDAGQNFENQIELQLATQIAENDPQMALQLADESLKKNASSQVMEIWRRLLTKDPKSAAKLTEAMITKIKSSDLMRDYAIGSAISEMIYIVRGRIEEQKAQKNKDSTQSQPAISLQDLERTYRDLLEVIVSTALRISPSDLMSVSDQGQARNVLSQAQMFLPDIEKYVPSRISALKAKLTQYDKAYYHPSPLTDNSEELEKKSAAELVAMAEKSNDETRELLYSQALAKAMEEGDVDLAKQISSKHLKGSQEFMNRELERLEREKALNEGNLEEARKTLDQIPTEAERATAIIHMGEAAKDAKSQRGLLDEAKAILGARMETRSQVESQLALATAYLKYDAEYSFSLLDAAVEKLNAVTLASLMLMKFSQEMQTEEEEIQITPAGMSSWFTSGIEDKILSFARKDFSRTQSSIARWQHPQTRLSLNMSLISMILGSEKNDLPQQSPRILRRRVY